RDRQQRAPSRKKLLRQNRPSWWRVNAASVAALPQHRVRNARRRRKSRKPLPKSRQRRRLRRRRPKVKRPAKNNYNWKRLGVKKFIHTVFDSATTKTGTRTGLQRGSSASSCLKI